MSKIYTGQCLCGAVKYEVDAFGGKMGHCHCSMCRKFHGAAFVTLGEIKKSDFRWIQGEHELQAYTAENGTTRRFCRHCGSSMTFSTPRSSSDIVEIAMGTLDTDLEQRPDAHIYVGSGANWVEVTDGLPQYRAGRDSERIK